MRVAADVAGQAAEAEVGPDGTAVLRLEVADVSLWWPRGHGEQPLYPISVRLLAGDAELETWQRQVGFRTVTLDTTPDATGTPFTFVVNGKPILVRGANWIPDDCFPSRIDRARYERSIASATDSGMNLLRVWGGGIYESEDFYEICDRDGLMVWQDFLFACAAYAEEEPLRGEVVAEAREAVTRLTPHPSLVLWNGMQREHLGPRGLGLEGDARRPHLGHGLLHRGPARDRRRARPGSAVLRGQPVVAGHLTSPQRPRPRHDAHLGRLEPGRLHRLPRLRAAVRVRVRLPGAAGVVDATRAVHDEPLRPDSPGVLLHQKAEDGNAKLTRGLAPHLAVPEDMEDWHWAMSDAPGPGRRLRHRALPGPGHRAAPARSSGS